MEPGVRSQFSKIPTGTPGLDMMLEGGIIGGRPYVISGGPGLGKTLLSCQFLMGSPEQKPGLFVAMDEPIHELKANMEQFGWDTSRIKFLDCTPMRSFGDPGDDTNVMIRQSDMGNDDDDILLDFSIKSLIEVISELVTRYDIDRCVIDSMTAIKLMIRDTLEQRKTTQLLMGQLSQMGLTSFLVSEEGSRMGEFFEYFLARGVIRLRLVDLTNRVKKGLQITKMRASAYDDFARPLVITSKGVDVYPEETLY